MILSSFGCLIQTVAASALSLTSPLIRNTNASSRHGRQRNIFCRAAFQRSTTVQLDQCHQRRRLWERGSSIHDVASHITMPVSTRRSTRRALKMEYEPSGSGSAVGPTPILSADFSAFAFRAEGSSSTTTTTRGAIPFRDARSPPPSTTTTSLFATKSTKAETVTPEEEPSPPPDADAPSSTPKRRRRRSRSRDRLAPGSLPPPTDFERVYELVKELRADKTAPVDQDGPHVVARNDFQILVALMLSSQTKDAVVGAALRDMQTWCEERGGGELDAEFVRSGVADDELNALISKVGFRNQKTRYLKETARSIVEVHDGRVPRTAAELVELPGVGPKMAHIVEYLVHGTCSGIGVDTHMHRMFDRLGWVGGDDDERKSTPERTREYLEAWLPREYWGEINVLWVGFGQETTQQKEKALRKAISCSRPVEALELYERLGMNCFKEAKRYDMEEEVKKILSDGESWPKDGPEKGREDGTKTKKGNKK